MPDLPREDLNETMVRLTYRYRGTNRAGDSRFGVWTDTRAGLATQVEKWYRQGWRTLTVVTGDGPVPPAEDEELQVAGIGRRPGERRRTCWYEQEADHA